MAKAQVKTQKISEESFAIPKKKEVSQHSDSNGQVAVDLLVKNSVENQDLEKNDYQNHPKFSKFNHAGGQ